MSGRFVAGRSEFVMFNVTLYSNIVEQYELEVVNHEKKLKVDELFLFYLEHKFREHYGFSLADIFYPFNLEFKDLNSIDYTPAIPLRFFDLASANLLRFDMAAEKLPNFLQFLRAINLRSGFDSTKLKMSYFELALLLHHFEILDTLCWLLDLPTRYLEYFINSGISNVFVGQKEWIFHCDKGVVSIPYVPHKTELLFLIPDCAIHLIRALGLGPIFRSFIEWAQFPDVVLLRLLM